MIRMLLVCMVELFLDLSHIMIIYVFNSGFNFIQKVRESLFPIRLHTYIGTNSLDSCLPQVTQKHNTCCISMTNGTPVELCTCGGDYIYKRLVQYR